MLFLPNLLKTNSASIDTKCWCVGERSNGKRYIVARSKPDFNRSLKYYFLKKQI